MKVFIDPICHRFVEDALEQGFKKHNIPTTIPEKADLIVTWGEHRRRKFNKDVLVIEAAYFQDRTVWKSMGFNGLNGHANFLNKNSPSDRWNKYFNDGRLKPWSDGDYFLVTLQKLGDASLSGSDCDYIKIINNLKPFGIPILVRTHPKNVKFIPINYNSQVLKADNTVPIEEQARKAKAVITVSSNTGVDAILAGTPVMNFSRYSMVWDLAMKKYEQLKDPWMPDRTQWCYDMAYTQWLPEEIENGDAWEHLKKFYTQ